MNQNSDPFSGRGFGASAPWIDLANSELYDGFGNFTECMDDLRWVRSFLRYWKLRLPANHAEARKSLRGLRTLLRRLVAKTAETKINSDDLEDLNAFLKVPVFPRLVESQSGFGLELEPAELGWRSEVAAIARSFMDSLIRERAGHLKICANEDCRWIFVDHTKGNVRRWCSDATCGNRDRVRRARRKERV
jgi:predicted RNA-binding Zn ribbon-like protein